MKKNIVSWWFCVEELMYVPPVTTAVLGVDARGLCVGLLVRHVCMNSLKTEEKKPKHQSALSVRQP